MALLKVGTRGSILALRQCYEVLAELQTTHWQKKSEILNISVYPIRTEGDKKQGTPEAGNLTKKAWIDEIEKALINKEIDVAVHSGKDLPDGIDERTELISISKRLFPFDVFIGKKTKDGRLKFNDLSTGDIVGTASKRRSRFVSFAKKGINVVELRGNVNTRISKIESDRSLSGILLAEAGIKRLGLDIEYERLPIDVIVPSKNQGILVAQFRKDDYLTKVLLSLILDEQTENIFKAEKMASSLLEAECSSCVGIYAYHESNALNLCIKAISSNYELVENTSSQQPNQPLNRFVQESVEILKNKNIFNIMNT